MVIDDTDLSVTDKGYLGLITNYMCDDVSHMENQLTLQMQYRHISICGDTNTNHAHIYSCNMIKFIQRSAWIANLEYLKNRQLK